MRTAIVLAVITLAPGAMLWAADGAVVAPQQGATAAPVTSDVVLSGDAITIPKMMSYQGRLTDASGVPVADGNYSVAFRLYTEPSGGSPFWSETQSVATRGGLFSILLGSVTPIGTAPNAGAAYLGMSVESSVEMVPRLRIAGTHASPSEEVGTSYVPPGGTDVDDAWVRIGSDSVLYTIHRLGIVRGESNNVLYGIYGYTQTIFGSSCTTGASGANVGNISIGGGYGNRAWAPFTAVCGGISNKAGNEATDTSAIVVGGSGNQANAKFAYIAGGRYNRATGTYAAIGGGYSNSAIGANSTVAGGRNNDAGNSTDDTATTVCGGTGNRTTNQSAFIGAGEGNTADGWCSVVAAGLENHASGCRSAVLGGHGNVASGFKSVVCGGYLNTASDRWATVGGGVENTASDSFATVGGGRSNTASVDYATVCGGYSCSAGHSFSAAFTQSHTIAANQVRAASFSTGSEAFSVDHPAAPLSKILNQYAVGSPELVLLYRGIATIGPDGRAEVRLPDYFDQMNRNPMVQVSGVGTSDVYVADKVSGNHFVIGGKPGTEVYWTVTGERKDLAADLARIFTPVEQEKTGDLSGHSLDDDALSGYMDGLQKLGLSGQYSFRTADGRATYEKTKQQIGEVTSRQE